MSSHFQAISIAARKTISEGNNHRRGLFAPRNRLGYENSGLAACNDYPGKSHKLQLDVWLPEKNLAFEYQGEQHYHNMSLAFGSSGDLVSYVARDFQKQAKCRKLGIELIVVPYWWDTTVDSLRAITHEHSQIQKIH